MNPFLLTHSVNPTVPFSSFNNHTRRADPLVLHLHPRPSRVTFASLHLKLPQVFFFLIVIRWFDAFVSLQPHPIGSCMTPGCPLDLSPALDPTTRGRCLHLSYNLPPRIPRSGSAMSPIFVILSRHNIPSISVQTPYSKNRFRHPLPLRSAFQFCPHCDSLKFRSINRYRIPLDSRKRPAPGPPFLYLFRP